MFFTFLEILAVQIFLFEGAERRSFGDWNFRLFFGKLQGCFSRGSRWFLGHLGLFGFLKKFLAVEVADFFFLGSLMFRRGDGRARAMGKRGLAVRYGRGKSKKPPLLLKEMKALGLTPLKREPTPQAIPVVPPPESIIPPHPPETTQTKATSTPFPETTPKPPPPPPPPPPAPKPNLSLPPNTPTYCLMSLESLQQFLAEHFLCLECDEGFCTITHTQKIVLAYHFTLTCESCGYTYELPSSPHLVGTGQIEVNSLLFASSVAGGVGRQTVNSLLSTFGIHKLKQKAWARGAAKMEKIVKSLWHEIREENLILELQCMKKEGTWRVDEKGRVLLEVTFDGTWTTRGYSSKVGFATYFGIYSKKPLFTSHRSKVFFFLILSFFSSLFIYFIHLFIFSLFLLSFFFFC